MPRKWNRDVANGEKIDAPHAFYTLTSRGGRSNENPDGPQLDQRAMICEPAPRLSIVIPIFNEEESVGPLLERLFAVLETVGEPFEVLCVDDGSTDASARLLDAEAERRAGLRVLHLETNGGQHAAVLAGFRAAAGRWIVTLDGDLQNPPEEIPKLISALERGHDVVSSYRRHRRDSIWRRAGSHAVNLLARRISGIPLRDFGCMLRGYSQRVARDIAEASSDSDDSNLFIPALAMRYATNPIEIEVRHEGRAAGDSKYPLGRLLRLTLDLVASARRPHGRASRVGRRRRDASAN